MRILVDATPLISLGTIGELDLLTSLDGRLEIPETVRSEVSSEPAKTNLRRLDERGELVSEPTIEHDDNPRHPHYKEAQEILDENEINGDVELIALVLVLRRHCTDEVTVISDDKRVRTVASGFGATVTGTFGVVARAVEKRDMTAQEGKDLVRRVDNHGLHTTGELREKAYEMVEKAANDE